MIWTDNATFQPAPFALPPDSIEITLDLPPPPSTNRIWRFARGHVYKSKEYVAWQRECDAAVLINKQYPRNKITGPFEFILQLAANSHNGDGDNRIKAVLDWLESRQIIANDKHCKKGFWEWVATAEAPSGCRVKLRSLHG